MSIAYKALNYKGECGDKSAVFNDSCTGGDLSPLTLPPKLSCRYIGKDLQVKVLEGRRSVEIRMLCSTEWRDNSHTGGYFSSNTPTHHHPANLWAKVLQVLKGRVQRWNLVCSWKKRQLKGWWKKFSHISPTLTQPFSTQLYVMNVMGTLQKT